MIRLATVALLGLIPACEGDETVARYGAANVIWHLTEISSDPIDATITMQFPSKGKIAGKAPCNSYSATMTDPYPWFEIGPIAATRMACPALDAETTFFNALASMSQSEILGGTLILRNDAGAEMVFKASE